MFTVYTSVADVVINRFCCWGWTKVDELDVMDSTVIGSATTAVVIISTGNAAIFKAKIVVQL